MTKPDANASLLVPEEVDARAEFPEIRKLIMQALWNGRGLS